MPTTPDKPEVKKTDSPKPDPVSAKPPSIPVKPDPVSVKPAPLAYPRQYMNPQNHDVRTVHNAAEEDQSVADGLTAYTAGPISQPFPDTKATTTSGHFIPPAERFNDVAEQSLGTVRTVEVSQDATLRRGDKIHVSHAGEVSFTAAGDRDRMALSPDAAEERRFKERNG